MHKTNGNMSSQHRNENTGQHYNVYCQHLPEYLRIAKTNVNLQNLTNQELEIWITGLKLEEDHCKNIRKARRQLVQIRKDAEIELAKREPNEDR